MNTYHEQHVKSSDFLSDIVIGMADGLTVPFALTAGLTGAIASTSIITTAGLAEIVAGSIAMGLGGYLAGKTEIEHYDAELVREYYEIESIPEKERQEVADEPKGTKTPYPRVGRQSRRPGCRCSKSSAACPTSP